MSAPATVETTAPAGTRMSCSEVTVRFGGVVAVNSVSIDIPPSSIIGLVGPNGAGKSTLFSVLSGLRRPNHGSVQFEGQDITHASAQHRARMGLARTFQHPEMFSGLTAREHIMLSHRIRTQRSRIFSDMVTARGFRRADRDEVERVDQLLDVLNLTEIANRPVAGLSLGMTRLVELARALAANPTVLLLDEPSSGLDAQETEQVIEVFRLAVERRGVSLLLVEHDVSMVLGLCDTVNVLDFGELIACGTPDEVRNDSGVRAAYLGEEDTTSKGGAGGGAHAADSDLEEINS
jgi:branched-chain amino acid transport system ATP-binding protein